LRGREEGVFTGGDGIRGGTDMIVEGPGLRPLRPAAGREDIDLFVDLLCGARPILLKEVLDGIEKRVIIRSLWMAGGNRKQAAGILGIKYTTLHEKLKRHGIRAEKPPTPFAF